MFSGTPNHDCPQQDRFIYCIAKNFVKFVEHDLSGILPTAGQVSPNRGMSNLSMFKLSNLTDHHMTKDDLVFKDHDELYLL